MEISDQTIRNQLNLIFEHMKKKYGAEYVFAVFAYPEKESKDMHFEAIVIPHFESICLNEPFILTIVDSVAVKDVRFIYDARRFGHEEMIQGVYTDYIIVSPRYEHIYKNLLLKPRERIKRGMETGVPAEELKLAVVKLLRFAWNDTSAAVRFCKQLTDAEKTALEAVVNAIGDEGYISQEKICQSCGVSRLTMTRLVEKMKNCEIAEVEYHGVKGTYIHFIDDTVMDIRGLGTY